MSYVRSVKNILVVLVAIAWLPMTMHCQLETVPGLELFVCQTDTESHNDKDSDCGDTGCCSAERSVYKTEQHRLTVLPSNLLFLSLTPVVDVADDLSAEANREAFTVAPPELPKCWQFVFRTAAPPRAPSFAS